VVDLAYSALLFGSKEIGAEVNHIESNMDKLKYKIRLASMLAARTIEDAEQLTGILQVANAAETIANAAGDIVKLLDMNMESRPFIPSILANADEKINTMLISDSSSIANRSLGELKLEAEIGVRIIAIKRNKRWIYHPEGNVFLKVGDRLVARGVQDGHDKLKGLADGEIFWEEIK
jgi:uncharacterized protein with PhoU and TrkA domain